MAIDPKTVRGAGKIVVDDWAQCQKGGQLFPLIQSGELTASRIHAEIGEVIAGRKPGRTSPDERIIFWHRGFAISDVMLGNHILERATAAGAGQQLTLFDEPDE
jgi:alanine dehydrogenase